MQIRLHIQNFILYLLLCVLITAGLYAVPASLPAVTAQEQSSSAVFCASGLSMPDECLPERISGRSASTLTAAIARSSRSASSYRFMLLFLACILTLMSFFTRLAEHLITFHDSRYLYSEDFIISFIQNTDGRKRNSYPFSS